MMKSAVAEFGAVDVLVNNAGILHAAPVDELPPAKWETILAVDLTAVFHTVRVALPAMKAGGHDRKESRWTHRTAPARKPGAMRGMRQSAKPNATTLVERMLA